MRIIRALLAHRLTPRCAHAAVFSRYACGEPVKIALTTAVPVFFRISAHSKVRDPYGVTFNVALPVIVVLE